MATDMSPAAVAKRLERLRAMWTPDDQASARARLEDPAGFPRSRTFAQAVALRLSDLRELCELTAYLHRGRHEMGSVARDEPDPA
jgi:hypothetical protein